MTITELIEKLKKAKEYYGDLTIRKGCHSSKDDTIMFYKKEIGDIRSVGQPEKWLELYL